MSKMVIKLKCVVRNETPMSRSTEMENMEPMGLMGL